MTEVARRGMDVREVVARIERGETLLCPSCRSPLRPIPETFKPGDRLYAIECPKDRGHYLTILEYADIREAMRASRLARQAPSSDG